MSILTKEGTMKRLILLVTCTLTTALTAAWPTIAAAGVLAGD
jgi:hypothetical protein